MKHRHAWGLATGRRIACSPWHVSALGRRDGVDAGPEWSAAGAASWFMTAWVGFSLGVKPTSGNDFPPPYIGFIFVHIGLIN